MAKWILREPRYIQQVGESVPRYVNASPLNPEIVNLPDECVVTDADGRNKRTVPFKPDFRLEAYTETVSLAPPELVPAHAVTPKAEVPTAAAAAVATPPTIRKGGRLSDS